MVASRMNPWRLRQYHRRSREHEQHEKGKRHIHTQTAYEIFSAAPSSYFDSSYQNGKVSAAFSGPRTVKGVVDGDEVVFELKENVTQRPATDRTKRFQEREILSINRKPSATNILMRFWAMEFSLPMLCLIYMGVSIALNFIFAGFWSIQTDKCCGDPEMSYLEIFDFAAQTSSTIGYGGYVPAGIFSNFLVVMMALIVSMYTAIYGGLLYSTFSSPTAKIQFSDIMTLSNVNGLPCIEIRVGNCDGNNNVLYDISARMVYHYTINYADEKGVERSIGQTEELPFLSCQPTELTDVVWTLRHAIDEESPLFGLNLLELEYPGNSIFGFRVSLQATQRATGGSVYAASAYEIQDIMIGHRFVDQIEYDPIAKKLVCDFAKFDMTAPQFVWHPMSRKPFQVT